MSGCLSDPHMNVLCSRHLAKLELFRPTPVSSLEQLQVEVDEKRQAPSSAESPRQIELDDLLLDRLEASGLSGDKVC